MIIIIIIAVLLVSCQDPSIFEEEQPYISGRVLNMEFENKDLKIAILNTSRLWGIIQVEISFQNKTQPGSGGQSVRVYVNPSNSYMIDESSWIWKLKEDDLGFTKNRVTINPGAKIRSKFYFEPAPNVPDTGREFQLVLTVMYRFDGSYNDNKIVIVFKNLQIK